MVLNQEQLIDTVEYLDDNGFLFKGYRLYRKEGRIHFLGEGGFSHVIQMISCFDDNQCYALKVIGFKEQVVSSAKFMESVRLQRSIYEETQNVVRIIAAKELNVSFDTNNKIKDAYETDKDDCDTNEIRLQFVLMEKLQDIICKDKFGNVRLTVNNLVYEDEVIEFAVQIGGVLSASHKMGILHRDIKLENVFWDEKHGVFKLGDFGLAKYTQGGDAETKIYTDGYAPPEIEIKRNTSYNQTADIYSFGISLYLLLNNLKFPGSNGYYFNVAQYDPEFSFPAPENSSPSLARVVNRMCSYYARERYQSIDEILREIALVTNNHKEVEDDKYTEEESDDETLTVNASSVDINTETIGIESDYSREEHGDNELSRYKRIKTEKENKQYYREIIVKKGALLACTLFLFLIGEQVSIEIVTHWEYYALAFAAILSFALGKNNFFRYVTEIGVIGFAAYLQVIAGINIPGMMAVILLVLGMQISVFSCGTAMAIFGLYRILGIESVIDNITIWDTGWVFLVCSMVIMYRLFIYKCIFEMPSDTYIDVIYFVFSHIGKVIFVMGLILVMLNTIGVISIPASIMRLHLVRSGIVYQVLLWGFNYFDDRFLFDEE